MNVRGVPNARLRVARRRIEARTRSPLQNPIQTDPNPAAIDVGPSPFSSSAITSAAHVAATSPTVHRATRTRIHLVRARASSGSGRRLCGNPRRLRVGDGLIASVAVVIPSIGSILNASNDPLARIWSMQAEDPPHITAVQGDLRSDTPRAIGWPPNVRRCELGCGSIIDSIGPARRS